MKLLFICKASTQIGFGHLIRSKTVAKTFKQKGGKSFLIDFIIIGDSSLSHLLNDINFSYKIFQNENEITIQEHFDYIFIDLLEVNETLFLLLREIGKKLISLSPIFNYLSNVDILFHRSKYIHLEDSNLPETVFSGIEYSIIQENCNKIDAGYYERNLNLDNLPIAISMGGGDAANKTLEIIKHIRNCPVPITFWVTLGEGYNHSYDELIKEIKGHQKHEIILARTNKSMWQILNNCVLAVLLSGLTSHEAVYAGLPSLIFYENPLQAIFVKELFEKKVSIDQGNFCHQNLEKLNISLEKLYNNRRTLFNMHLNTKELIKRNGSIAIFEKINSF